MVVLIVFLSLVAIVASIWFMGTWSITLTLVNVFISSMVASSLYERVADQIDMIDGSFTYVADFLAAWLLFFLTFGLIRLFADGLSKYKLKFSPLIDYPSRAILATCAAWIFVCFACFTLHMAPASGDLFAGGPRDRVLMAGPDHLWLRFLHSRSKGALADAQNTPLLPAYDLAQHPDDAALNVRVFDPWADFVFKYRDRRDKWSAEEQLRVFRKQ